MKKFRLSGNRKDLESFRSVLPVRGLAVLAVLLACQLTLGAEEINYRSTEFAIGARNSHGSISWGDWEKSNVGLSIDWEALRICIASPEPQVYDIYEKGEETKDSGGTSIDSFANDADGGRCRIRFRIQNDGTSQLYVFYNDIAWVYNIVRQQEQPLPMAAINQQEIIS